MTTLIISAFAAAFVVGAINELIIDLGKWRGLVSLVVSAMGAFFMQAGDEATVIFTSLGAAFLSLAVSAIVSALMPVPVTALDRKPRRIPPL